MVKKYFYSFLDNPIISIISFNIILYVPIIFYLPNHILDDYVVFGNISGQPNYPISIEPDSPYFLFLRPVSYLSFWIDYKLFSYNPAAMKFVSLVLQIMLVIVFYKTSVTVKNYFKLDISNKWITFITIIFSIYPENLRWIIWIANRTELLMITFYALSIYYFIKYNFYEEAQYKNLIYSFAFFVLSIGSKQQSLHLPILFLAYNLVNPSKLELNKRRNLFYLIILEIIVVLVVVIINYKLHTQSTEIFINNLWKKPFSLVGIILIVINPFYGEEIYNYFLHNKQLIYFIAPITIAAIYYIAKRYKGKTLLYLLIIYLIISFPRIFSHATSRINSIYIFFLFLLLIFIVSYYKHKIVTSSFILFFILNIVTLSFMIKSEKVKENNHARRINNLVDLYNDNSLILISRDQLVLQYQYHFSKYGIYGNSKLHILPLQYWELTYSEYSKDHKKIFSACRGNRLIIKTLNDDVMLTINPSEVREYNFLPNNLITVADKSDRGFSTIEFDIPDDYKNKKIIYHDGVAWQKIK